ncbi:hypothetical protein JRI60_17565 [Archangium violaceum]|nr:hypothetical protein [Archangium violaceum]QRO00706.1 hypothetical protein JRI60_17565 [Archangium violaceum]
MADHGTGREAPREHRAGLPLSHLVGLELLGTRTYLSGVVLLHYAVKR